MTAPAKELKPIDPGSVQMIPSPPSEAAAIINMIERAARDPAVDVDKLRQLMDMRGQVAAQEAERAFDAAMTKAQEKMRPVAADSNNPQTKSKYASYAALDKALRPIYTENGFSLSFNTGDGAPESYVRVVCRVSHKSGHREKYHIDMPADGKGAKGGDVMTKTHATGSAVSYGTRYLLKMIFNISVGDDDGNAASDTGELFSQEQADQIKSLIAHRGIDLPRFMTWIKRKWGADKIEDIRAAHFQACINTVNQADQ